MRDTVVLSFINLSGKWSTNMGGRSFNAASESVLRRRTGAWELALEVERPGALGSRATSGGWHVTPGSCFQLSEHPEDHDE